MFLKAWNLMTDNKRDELNKNPNLDIVPLQFPKDTEATNDGIKRIQTNFQRFRLWIKLLKITIIFKG